MEKNPHQVKVYKRPVVAILSTGDELISLEDATSATGPLAVESGWTGVVDTNRPSLRATLEGLGYEVVDVGIARDRCVLSCSSRAAELYG